MFSLSDFDSSQYRSRRASINPRFKNEDSFKSNINSDSLLNFHSILNPKSLKDVEDFINSCDGEIPR